MDSYGRRVRTGALGFFLIAAVSLVALLLAAPSAGLESGAAGRDAAASPTPASYANLPLIARNFNPAWTSTPTTTPTATPTNTPTPTSTPVTGCLTIPTLLGPPDGSAPDTLIPLFQWDSGNNPNATGFLLEIWLDPDLTLQIWSLGSSYHAQGIHDWRPSKNLDPATTHYWRTYLMCDDIQGPYSELWSFTTGSEGTIPPAPSLLSPPDGSTLAGTIATLRWTSVSGAAEYLISWSTGGPATYRARRDTTEATLLTLSPNTTYEWWVQARNDYAWGDESAHWQFTTGSTASSLPPDPSSPYYIYEQGVGTTTIFEEQK
jgi:hypothetical protein